jgi:predicted nucleic acid-binding protein
VPSVYLDACCFIHLVEGTPAWRSEVEARLRVLAESPDTHFVTSDLTRIECRTKPLRDKNQDLLHRYDRLLYARELSVLPISRSVVDRATELRATYRVLKTPDALHLAAALVAGAERFLTGDASLQICTDLLVEALRPVAEPR